MPQPVVLSITSCTVTANIGLVLKAWTFATFLPQGLQCGTEQRASAACKIRPTASTREIFHSSHRHANQYLTWNSYWGSFKVMHLGITEKPTRDCVGYISILHCRPIIMWAWYIRDTSIAQFPSRLGCTVNSNNNNNNNNNNNTQFLTRRNTTDKSLQGCASTQWLMTCHTEIIQCLDTYQLG